MQATMSIEEIASAKAAGQVTFQQVGFVPRGRIAKSVCSRH